jgi:hypothetical protein
LIVTAVKYLDRARMSTSTTGTGTITLGAAVAKYQSFVAAGAANNDILRYVIEDGNAWEIGTGTYTTSGTTLSRTLISSSTGSLLNLSGSAEAFVAAVSTDLSAFDPPHILLEDQRTSGTNGGTATSGSDQVRTINTEVYDVFNLCSLSSNQFTLSAGTYWIEANAACTTCALNQILIWNATGSTELLRGMSCNNNAASFGTSQATLSGKYTIAASQACELRHRVSSTQANNGFGLPCSFGTERYAQLRFWRIS